MPAPRPAATDAAPPPVAAPKSEAELQAEALQRRQWRALRKARAEGFLAGAAAMLRPGDLALDCGANLGKVTDILARTGADVIAFEPDPWTFERLSARFSGVANVTLVNAALGVSEGRVRLHRATNFDSNPSGASVKSTILSGGHAIDDSTGPEVALIDFPAFLHARLAERDEIALVKLDIEGAELDILEAMDRASLFDRIRVLLAETHERKFLHLRPRFHALRQALAKRHDPARVNLDWI